MRGVGRFQSKIVVLLTDGENNSGGLRFAASRAKVNIHAGQREGTTGSLRARYLLLSVFIWPAINTQFGRQRRVPGLARGKSWTTREGYAREGYARSSRCRAGVYWRELGS